MLSRLILRTALPPGLTSSADARHAEPVLGILVAVALDAEEHPPVHQARFVEGDVAVAVGVVADVVGGLKLDQRHAASGLVVDDLDLEVLFGRCGRQLAES